MHGFKEQEGSFLDAVVSNVCLFRSREQQDWRKNYYGIVILGKWKSASTTATATVKAGIFYCSKRWSYKVELITCLKGMEVDLDLYLNEGIDKDDCWYDVRIMGNQPLCPKKRKFFNIANGI